MIYPEHRIEDLNPFAMQKWNEDPIPHIPFEYETTIRQLKVGQYFIVPYNKKLKQEDLWKLCFMVSGISGMRFRLRTEQGLDGKLHFGIWRDR